VAAGSEVGARPFLAGALRELAPHLLELLAGGHLLGEERGLDAVEQPFEPPDQLGLRDAQLDIGRRGVLAEGEGQPGELLLEVDSADPSLAPRCRRSRRRPGWACEPVIGPRRGAA
jgi:hypothetical protein